MAILDERITAIGRLSETIDLPYESFCLRRLSKVWKSDLEQIQAWPMKAPSSRRRTG